MGEPRASQVVRLLLVLFLLGSATSVPALWGGDSSGWDEGIIHGNWCGPGHRVTSSGAPRPPQDAVDRACMYHDICYRRYGAHSCGCDIAFMRSLGWIQYPDGDSDLRDTGRTLYDAIAAKPCRGPGLMVKWRMGMQQMMEDFTTGRSMPWDVPRRWGETWNGGD